MQFAHHGMGGHIFELAIGSEPIPVFTDFFGNFNEIPRRIVPDQSMTENDDWIQ